MLSVTVACVGKIKEKFFTEAVLEYSKRLARYCKFKILEVKDEPTPVAPTERESEIVLNSEAEKLLAKVPNNSYVIALCVEGKQKSSEDFADEISKISVNGVSHICIIIGGSMGLSEEIKRRADMRLSFSKMTFPHQLMRVILAEQLYRAFTIIEGKTYHK
ncbi:MAG: 23S rRNA (pseudouridine(1915)-N(3))-methyltransferase RlmH [Oscillospiraceae bacterium]